jgi:large subunit ribosomal protein L7/L12
MRRYFVCGLWLLAAVYSQTLTVRAEEDLQHGETILATNQAPLDAPLRRHPKALWFELSNLRKDSSRLSPFGNEIALDFRRDQGASGWHEVVMVVKTKTGRHEYRAIGPSPFADQQGTVRGSSWFGPWNDRLGDQLEVWLEQQQYLGGKQVRMKVSKSITLGNVGQLTYARQWTTEEQKAFQDWEKSTTPPPAPPAGYQVAKSDTPLLSGMPILAGWMAAWQPGEIIDVRKDGSILVKYRDVTSQLITRQRSWVAVEGKTLEAGRLNPGQFQASVKVLPGGTTPVPADLLPIVSDTPLVKGTPVKAEWAGQWSDVTILDVRADGKVRIHWDNYGSAWDEDRERSTLLIAPATLDALKKPGASDQFAKRAESLAPGAFGSGGAFASGGAFGSTAPSFPRNLNKYPISIAIPSTAVRVTDKTPLAEGTKLGCSWGSRWYDVTVLEVHDDGSVKIRWDNFGTAWDGDLSRDCLVIDKKVLAKLETNAKTSSAAKPAIPTDPFSGGDQFKVVLKAFGVAKIPVTKVVMDATGLDLKDAKEFVESAPVTLKQNLTKAAAEKLKKELQDAGATVAIELQ